MPVQGNLGARTPAEDLWLLRRVLGLTQPEMAARYGIGRTVLWQAEKGLRGAPWATGVGRTHVGTAPLLALARRRYGLRLERAAVLYGVSVPTYIRREAAGDDRLVTFWSGRGFSFPPGGVYIRSGRD